MFQNGLVRLEVLVTALCEDTTQFKGVDCVLREDLHQAVTEECRTYQWIHHCELRAQCAVEGGVTGVGPGSELLPPTPPFLSLLPDCCDRSCPPALTFYHAIPAWEPADHGLNLNREPKLWALGTVCQ